MGHAGKQSQIQPFRLIVPMVCIINPTKGVLIPEIGCSDTHILENILKEFVWKGEGKYFEHHDNSKNRYT
ncbi:MAG: hypothetical protein P8Y23_17545 [Candidatus Lokiarchaeota archaeon]|jgi:hypothetical protein